MMRIDVLAIAAHPDDVELTCGGTLVKMAALGYKTGVIDLTAGEMGTRGTPEIRAREAAAAARILGVTVRENLGLPDSDVSASRGNKLLLAAKIRALRPHTVILPYWEGRHPDHYNASKLGYEGCFLAGLTRLPIEGDAFRPYKIIYATAYARVRPTFVVNITKEFERRRRAILAYGSQFRPKKARARSKVYLPLDELQESMQLVARHFGQMAGVRYAEPFLVREMMEVEDVTKMAVRSL
jgi:bacillithiol biosynthesis deacetylase BshB1